MLSVANAWFDSAYSIPLFGIPSGSPGSFHEQQWFTCFPPEFARWLHRRGIDPLPFWEWSREINRWAEQLDYRRVDVEDEYLSTDKKDSASHFDENEFRRLADRALLVLVLADDERSADSPGIPAKFRSRSMTKAEAAQLHSGGGCTNATSYFASRPEITIEGKGWCWRFDIRQFPEDVRDEMLKVKRHPK